MDAAERYQKDFDRLMQEVEAEAKRRDKSRREEAWKIVEKSFAAFADIHKLTPEQREAAKKKLLDQLFAHDQNSS